MGNLISSNNRKCCKCGRVYGDYGVDYICLIIGRGKYNNKYICFDCINKDKNNNETFENLR